MNMNATRLLSVGLLTNVLWCASGCGSASVSKKGQSPSSGGESGDGQASESGGEQGSTGGGAAGGKTGAGGKSATGGKSGSGGQSGTSTGGTPSYDSGVVSVACTSDGKLPAGAPALKQGMWTDIRPAGIPWGDNGQATGFAINPCNPAVLYVCIGSFDTSMTTKGGLYRTTDAGATWTKVGKVQPNYTGTDHLDQCASVRVDPHNPDHLYVGQGVRGNTEGFWISTDGGDSFTMPDGFKSLNLIDVYDVAPDPNNFSHVLLSFHSGTTGVTESTDGGNTWKLIPANTGAGSGDSIDFLSDPGKGIGDAQTWLLGTQETGHWRTTDSGATWTQVSMVGIQHGGGTIYYDKAGILYASGAQQNIRSTDNGQTWASVGGSYGYNAVYGDGTTLFTSPSFGPTPFYTSPEGGDGTTWTAFNSQSFDQGSFEMVYDSINHILYSSMWVDGVWALQR